MNNEFLNVSVNMDHIIEYNNINWIFVLKLLQQS